MNMEHTKKFVLMDPRFVRPSMRDKVLSRLDQDISNILDSDASDEAKAKTMQPLYIILKTFITHKHQDQKQLKRSRRQLLIRI